MLVYSIYIKVERLGVKAGLTDFLTTEEQEYRCTETFCPIKELSTNFMGDDTS